MVFWDYGNAFLLESSRAGAPSPARRFFYLPLLCRRYYGPMCFDYGFGPFRWVCTSGTPEDLATTDSIAAHILEDMASSAPTEIRQQLRDNLRWINAAADHKMVVGSQARILYSDYWGRTRLALAFNQAIREGKYLLPLSWGAITTMYRAPIHRTANC
jgi:urocanate hydratase